MTTPRPDVAAPWPCPECQQPTLFRLETTSEPEGIRKDAGCARCLAVFAVTKAGLVRMQAEAERLRGLLRDAVAEAGGDRLLCVERDNKWSGGWVLRFPGKSVGIGSFTTEPPPAFAAEIAARRALPATPEPGLVCGTEEDGITTLVNRRAWTPKTPAPGPSADTPNSQETR